MNVPVTLVVSISKQTLAIYSNQKLLKTYPVNTAKNGLGEQQGSECTPRGKHIIRAKIGSAAPLQSVFVGRRLTGEIYSPTLAKNQPDRDWILTRIMWLSGVEKGVNRLAAVDTMRRYIYIHGAPDEMIMSGPASHGCVRMHNEDVIDLFDRVSVNTPVLIEQ
ncbi:MAG: L,D-transpeptidase [Piscirickettsiaceae bacterium]|nr:MAG: L,D-transpeptidase [Piscirickettsiaceae bacterium]